MVMGAAEAATASMVSTIPVVVTGGVLMKFTEAMLPMQRAAAGGQRRTRKRQRQSIYGRNYSGNFSNVGY